MSKYHVNVTLTSKSPLNVGCKVTLRKQPENEHDNEAIAVILYNGEPDGYVANFYKTRRTDTWSAGRLLDKIPHEVTATISDLDPVVAEVEVESTELNYALLCDIAVISKKYVGPVSKCCMTGEATGELCQLHSFLAELELRSNCLRHTGNTSEESDEMPL